jgi:hypothetical protein
MSINYLLIDLENVNTKFISGLSENQEILIFTGSKQNKISRDLVISTQPYGQRVKWIAIEGNGLNAVDFHIAFYIGVYSEKDKNASFTILSKDTGFDPLVKHIVSKGIKCKRISEIKNIGITTRLLNQENNDINEIVANLESLLLKCDTKIRPKKYRTFISFVKSRGVFTDDVLKTIVETLVFNKTIEIRGERICYFVDDDLPF